MHKLPDLSFDFGALEPHLDGRTMQIHHDKHHQTYVDKLNAALEQAGGGLAELGLHELMQRLEQVPENLRSAVRNNGGGHYNHCLYWQILCPGGKSVRSAELDRAIERDFGSLTGLKEKFNALAAGHFASGWAWLAARGDRLEVISMPGHDNPLMTGQGRPLLVIDLWEHAYYLEYQNRRPDFIRNWWEVVNWEEASRRFGSEDISVRC